MVDVLIADLFAEGLSLTVTGDDGMLEMQLGGIPFWKMVIFDSPKLAKIDFFVFEVIVVELPFFDLNLGNQNEVFLKFMSAGTVSQGIWLLYAHFFQLPS